MDKKGQFEISFGMIFSIIIIIATIGISFYVINFFLNLNDCTQVGTFYDGLQAKVNTLYKWSGSDFYEQKVPRGIDKVCFGTLFNVSYVGYEEEYELLSGEYYGDKKSNVFMYPPNKACDGKAGARQITNARTYQFFCLDNTNNKMKISLTKGNADRLVIMKK